MTQSTGSRTAGSRSEAAQRSGRRGFVSGTTEARPGIMTTEFWLSLIMAVTVIVAGYVSDAFDVDTAWALGAGIIAAYALSRGLAKAGSREGPFMVDLTQDGDGQRGTGNGDR
jgi:hypothetical protein